MSSIPTVGKATSQLLNQYGVDTIFGIPGVHNVELFRGIEEIGMEVILPRHEQGAAFMADGYARASGRPGVCYSISGPGVTNSLTALAQAYSDSIPVLMLASSLPRKHAGKNHSQLHEMLDQQGAVSAVTELCMTADCDQDIEEFCARAFTLFHTTRPRPAYLQIPIDLIGCDAGRQYNAINLPDPPGVKSDDLTSAAACLRTSKKTVMILGGGAINAAHEIQTLSGRLNAAVFTTPAGKGIVPGDHSQSAGSALQQSTTHEFLRNAEVALVIGSELGSRDFFCDPLPFSGTVIRIDIDPAALTGANLADILVLSDAKNAVQKLLNLLPGVLPGYSDTEISLLREESKAEIFASQPEYAPLLDALRTALPRDAIVATDMTMPAYFGSQVFDTYQPRTWLHPNGFGTLGFALPAGIGAKIGAPSRPVVVLAGDYGFQYTMQELSVAVQQKLPIPVVLWNNKSLFAIEDAMIENKISPVAVHCDNPDFCALAEAMHAASARPASFEDLQIAIRDALFRDKPTIIEIEADNIK